MSGYWEIEASAGPAREGLVGGGAQLLVRVRLFDPGEDPQADAFIDLRPACARRLALELLAATRDAEQQTATASWWEPRR